VARGVHSHGRPNDPSNARPNVLSNDLPNDPSNIRATVLSRHTKIKYFTPIG
jgi:hypothetical protein